LRQIDRVGESGALEQYHLFYAARADILRRMGRQKEAARAYREALRLATNQVEQEFLRQRLSEMVLRTR
jgi:RNA polymerase sigma-70 factor (ECF subfamily)